MIFFDNASTTKVHKEIMEELNNLNNDHYYNAGGLYSVGRKSNLMIEEYRKGILDNLCGEDYDLIFTGSASESNNLALFGVLKKNTRKILVSMGEHPSVYNVAMEIKQRGHDVEFINLDKSGRVDIEDFKKKMTADVDIVSIMHCSNETGAINDISRLVKIAKKINKNVIFHSDGVQACGKIDSDLYDLGVDMYTVSAHKIHGFKGVGGLFVKKGIKLKPIIYGGGQESGIRSGTENLMGIYSLYRAIDMATKNRESNYKYITSLKNLFLDGLAKTKLNYVIHSDGECSPYVVSISFIGCRAETILNMLSDKGICVGNGSACSSKNSGNRVLENMGVSLSEITSNLRISFSKYNTEDEVGVLVNELNAVVVEYIGKV